MTGMTSVVPVKTPLGQEEMRQRGRALNQRHRTVLFLVDGRRPLGEVLALAQQAGAQTSHFEELVRLGLVEVPVEAADDSAAPADASPEQPGSPEASPAIEVVELDAPLMQAGPEVPQATPAASAAPAPLPAEMLQPAARPLRARAPLRRAKPVEDFAAASLDEVRERLIDTLRLDAPLFSARMLIRVRGAHTARELIELVWEIEGHLSHVRRSRSELGSLQRARELLGLGNTLFAEDSRLETEAGAL